MSDSYLVEANLKLKATYFGGRKEVVILARRLGKKESKRRFEDKTEEKDSMVEDREVGRVEKEWEVFKDYILWCAREPC